MPISIDVGGSYKPVTSASIEVSGAWKAVAGAWMEQGGAWVPVIGSGELAPDFVWQFIGSSTTASDYPDTTAQLMGWPAGTWFKDGVGASTLEGFTTRFVTNCDVHYNAGTTNVVIVQHGINDTGNAAEVYADLVAFCQHVKGLHTTNPWKIIVLSSIYPKAGGQESYNNRAAVYDQLYIDNADFHNGTLADGVVWVHAQPLLKDSSGSYFEAAHFHLSDLGHDTLAATVADEILSVLAGYGRAASRPQLGVTGVTDGQTVFNTITLSATAIGAVETEVWAGPYVSIGTGAIQAAKIGSTVFGQSGEWNIDTTQWPDLSTAYIFVVGKNALGCRSILQMSVAVSQSMGTAPPAITAQPQSQWIDSGANVTLAVSAVGVPTLAYQWQEDLAGTWTNIAGATSSSHSFTAVARSFRCIISNGNGSTTSSVAVITVNSASVIFNDTFSTDGALNGAMPDLVGSAAWASTANLSKSGGICTMTSASTKARVNVGVSDNFIVRTKVRATESGCAPCVLFRANSSASTYVSCRYTPTAVSLYNYTTIIGTYTFPTTHPINKWHDLHVRVEGSTITAFLDGVQVLQRTSTHNDTGTYAGIHSGTGGISQWDFLMVETI